VSIRFQNQQHIRTGTLSTFTGATTFTWSLRLLIDSMTYTGDAIVFGGQFFGMFALRFTAVSGSNVVMRASVTQAGGGNLTTPTFQVPIGRPVHLAGVYNGSNLRVYLNAASVALTSTTAPLAVSESRLVFVGIDPTVTGFVGDYHLDDLCLWRNVALTTAQLRALRDQVPFDVDPGPAFLSWSLDGTAGQGVLTTSPGVQSAGITTAFISTPPPVFADRDMAYVPSVRVQSAALAPSGKGILIRLEDVVHGGPVAPSAIGTTPTLTVDGAPVDLAAIGPLWQANTLPYVYYPLAVAVDPAAAVRLSAPVGWAQAGALGEVQGMADLAVASPGPAILPELPTGPKQLNLGWNVPAPYNYSQVRAYANLLRQGSRYFGPQVSGTTPTITYDPVTLFPSDVTGGEIACRVSLTAGAVFDPRGYATLPAGTYVLLWDGTGNARLLEEVGHGFSQVSSDLVGPTDKRRTYSLTLTNNPALSRGVQLRLVISGQVANVRVHGPATPLDGSEKFHPGYLRMLAGSRLIRFMDATQTNNSSRVALADLPNPDQFTFDAASHFKSVSRSIASIGPYENADGYFFPNGRTHLLVTTTTPHGLATGQLVYFTNLTGGTDGNGQLVLNNGTRVNLGWIATSSLPTICRVLSPTTLALGLFTGITGAPGQPAGTQAITGQVRLDIANIMPFADCIELGNRVGADPWICVPHAFTDEATAALAAGLVPVLGPGRKLRVEYTNEHWNLAPGFQQAEFCASQGAIVGLTPTQWYAKRTGEVHAIFAAAFASAGRPGDLIRIFGSQSANSGITSQIVGYCAAQAIPVDEIAIAPYFYNAPGNSPTRWAALDPDQAHDLSDLAILRFTGKVAAHRAILQASYPAAAVVCYEGGMELGVATQNYGGNAATAAALSRAWVRHPRIRRTVLQYCQNLENEGCAAFAYYGLAGDMPNYSGMSGSATWFAYNRTDQPAGLGDGSDGRFDNRADFQDLGRVVSVVGQGVEEWIGMMAAADEGKAEVDPRPSSMPGRITPAQLRGRRARHRPGGR
jgi:hypothetical protein